jgi:quercetin dioxygenase-like cupin family protein
MYCEAEPVDTNGLERYASMFPKDRIVSCGPGAKWSVLAGDGVTLVYWAFEAPKCGDLPMHQHAEKQSGYILDGEMTLHYEDGTSRVLQTGDFYSIPGGVAHGATVNGKVVILDIYAPRRTDFEERFRFNLRARRAAKPSSVVVEAGQ